jgi:hypothetical protein
MSPTNRTAEESFVDVVQALGGRPGVTRPERAAASGGRFGASALKVNGRIFAMVTGGRLVLKLPQGRVAQLIASGSGHPFDAGRGRPMREWVSLDVSGVDQALGLATEALEFCGRRR